MLPKVIGLVGPIRAGKTTAARIISKCYGYSIASNSEILLAILSHMGIEATRPNLTKLGDSLFKVLGNEIIGRFRLANLADGPIIIDGIRYREEVELYSSEPSFKLIGISADENSRFARAAVAASLKDTGLDRYIFSNLSKARSEMQVPSLLEKCDAIIENTGSIEAYETRVHEVFKQWSNIKD